MFVNCPRCPLRYPDEYRWSLCPHALRPRSHRPLLPEPDELDEMHRKALFENAVGVE